jgi:hypothetical protein
VLPHVIDVAEAMKPGAPVLHDHLITEGVKPPPTKRRTSPSASSSTRATPRPASPRPRS